MRYATTMAERQWVAGEGCSSAARHQSVGPSQPGSGGRGGAAARNTTCPAPTDHEARIGTPGRASIVCAPGFGRAARTTNGPEGGEDLSPVPEEEKRELFARLLAEFSVTVPVIWTGSR